MKILFNISNPFSFVEVLKHAWHFQKMPIQRYTTFRERTTKIVQGQFSISICRKFQISQISILSVSRDLRMNFVYFPFHSKCWQHSSIRFIVRWDFWTINQQTESSTHAHFHSLDFRLVLSHFDILCVIFRAIFESRKFIFTRLLLN